MSEDTPIGVAIIEKVLGLILIIVGATVTLNSMDPPAGDIAQFAGIFTAIGVVVIAAGIFLIVVRTK